jgi:hypothetical protein
MKVFLKIVSLSWYLFVLLFALLIINCGKTDRGDNAMELTKLIPNQFGDWKTLDEVRSYNRETIFDYIDGAGEVYLMYDFKEVAVSKFLGPDSAEITVEIFDMGTTGDAFGVFSHSREGNDMGIGGGSESRDGFLCFWKDRYFVCVHSSKQSGEFNNAVIAIGRDIESKITGDVNKPDIVEVLPGDGLVESSVIYFHKQTSLNYHYFLSEENILNLGEHTDAVLAVYRPGRITLLCIEYPDTGSATESFGSFISKYIPEADESGTAEVEEGVWIRAFITGRYFIAAFDAPDETTAVSLVNNVKENISRMKDG